MYQYRLAAFRKLLLYGTLLPVALPPKLIPRIAPRASMRSANVPRFGNPTFLPASSQLAASFTGPGPVEWRVDSAGEKALALLYRMKLAGSYCADVWLDGQAVSGAPVMLDVVPGAPCPTYCTVSGTGRVEVEGRPATGRECRKCLAQTFINVDWYVIYSILTSRYGVFPLLQF